MAKKYFYTYVLLQFCVGTIFAQYQSKPTKIKTEEYEGTVEVCSNCKITPAPNKTYKWLKGGKLGESKGKFEGQLIHGKVELFSMGMSGEREMVEKGNYFTGLRDGKIEEYAFGNLENIETYNKGDLMEIEFYHPENKVLDHKIIYTSSADVYPRKSKMIFYYSINHTDADKKPLDKKLGRRIEVEGYHVPNGTTFSNFYEGSYKKITIWQDIETLRQEGTYLKNRKQGTWKTYYGDDVVAVEQYDKDMLVSEQFLKDNMPFTGTVRELSLSKKSAAATIEVKNGVRDGKTSDNYRESATKEMKPTRIIEYVAGKPKAGDDLGTVLKGHKIIREAEYTQECDSKGSGLLFLDRIQYTDKGAFAYFHTVNLTFVGGSAISTAPVGDKNAFSAFDLTTKKVYKMNAIYDMPLTPYNRSAAYGEMSRFVVYFEGLTQTVKKISFVEGDPETPYEIDEKTGNTTYKWGCYELNTK